MNDFIDKRHAGFAAPESVVFGLVKKATGKSPTSKTRIIAGNDNEVYDVETETGNFIVRIHRFGSVGYREEVWAIEECRKKGVPVPEVLLLDTVQLDGTEYDAMVQVKLKGKDFRTVIDSEASKADIEKVLYEAGAQLKKIHEIKVDGFYRLLGEGEWDFRTWEDVMNSSIKDRTAEKEQVLRAGFSESEFEEMIHIHEAYKDQYPCRQPILCQGDYTPEHWFVNDKMEITGVIDFGDMQGGPAMIDFALFEYFEPELSPMSFYKGYGIADAHDAEFQKKLHMQKVVLMVGYLAHYVRERNEEEITDTIPLLRRSLEWLKTNG